MATAHALQDSSSNMGELPLAMPFVSVPKTHSSHYDIVARISHNIAFIMDDTK
jgi:hypothetical protein